MKRLILINLLLELVVAIEKINYCDKTLCNVGENHIACNKNGAFGSECGKNAHVLNIDKNKILRGHNKLRGHVAQSGIAGFANISSDMQWDNELALLAEFGVKQCRVNEKDCFSTKNYKNTGVNFALDRFPGNPDANEMVISQIIKWFNGYKSAKPQNGQNANFFLQMIHGKTNRVGCAALQYNKDDMTNQLLICVYNESVKEGVRFRSEPVKSIQKKETAKLVDWLKRKNPQGIYGVSAETTNTNRDFSNNINLAVKN